MTLTLVVPFSRRPSGAPAQASPASAPRQAARRELPARPVLGLIDNGKIKADTLLTSLGEALLARGAIADYFLHRKAAMVPISEEERDHIGARADVVVAGLGDCGGCTACSTTDALHCIAIGIPSFMLASEKFAFLVDATDREYGLVGLERLYVEHPVWSREDGWFAEAGERLADRWLETLGRVPADGSTPLSSPRSVADALSELRRGMEADGYDLAIESKAQGVTLAVTARDGTCPTCLIPEDMFGNIAFETLKSAGFDLAREQLRVTYPGSGPADAAISASTSADDSVRPAVGAAESAGRE